MTVAEQPNVAARPLHLQVAPHAIGLGQVVSWGTTYYALGILAGPISETHGWSTSMVLAGLSVGLLVAAAISSTIGAMIDRHGARSLMTLGALMAGFALIGLAFAGSWTLYVLFWSVLGVAMRLTLYDAAFAAVVRLEPGRGQRSIAYVSLWGGFASSVFWPAGHWLALSFGLQDTLLVFAALNMCVCAPLYWLGLRSAAAPQSDAGSSVPAPTSITEGPSRLGLQGALRTVAMVLFAGAMGIYAFIMGAAAVHLVSVVASTGVSLEEAVAATAFMGIAQVGARFVQTFLGQKLGIAWQTRIPIWLLPCSFLFLLLAPASWLVALSFALLFGSAKGLVTIVRGTLPLALFGTEQYGQVLGKIAVPSLIVGACAPFTLALVNDVAGPDVVLTAMTVASVLTLTMIETLLHLTRRSRAHR